MRRAKSFVYRCLRDALHGPLWFLDQDLVDNFVTNTMKSVTKLDVYILFKQCVEMYINESIFC